MNYWLIGAAAALATIGVVHSVMGERRIFRVWDGHAPVGVPRVHRQILRASWHLPSLLGLGQALALALWGTEPAPISTGGQPAALAALAMGVGACGIVVLWLTRGRHQGGTALLLTALLMAAGMTRVATA